MDCQKHLFNLKEGIYLNAAYMSPQLRSVSEVGQKSLMIKEYPPQISQDDFFVSVDELRKKFSTLINASHPERIVVIPSVSYGMANVIQNLIVGKRKRIMVVSEQFPSNVYPWLRLAQSKGIQLQTISPTLTSASRGEIWNDRIIAQIDDEVLAIAIPHVHWSDGTIFQLSAISQKAKKHGVKLIVDGTQSIGVMPFDLDKIPVDALIVAGYKWLMGPYGIGLAYYNESFDHGIPIEESWINRSESQRFENLVKYQAEYRTYARRYEVGEASNFIHVPMLTEAISQLLTWGVKGIQAYVLDICLDFVREVEECGWTVDKKYRAGHLFGIRPPAHVSLDSIFVKTKAAQISLSLRGDALRISPHVYNTSADLKALATLIRSEST